MLPTIRRAGERAAFVSSGSVRAETRFQNPAQIRASGIIRVGSCRDPDPAIRFIGGAPLERLNAIESACIGPAGVVRLLPFVPIRPVAASESPSISFSRSLGRMKKMIGRKTPVFPAFHYTPEVMLDGSPSSERRPISRAGVRCLARRNRLSWTVHGEIPGDLSLSRQAGNGSKYV